MNTDYFFKLDGPLDSGPTERQMRIANLSGFQDLVRHLGADPRAILELSLIHISEPTRPY